MNRTGEYGTMMECSQCKEVVEVLGERVTLPFVCMHCESINDLSAEDAPGIPLGVDDTVTQTFPATGEFDVDVIYKSDGTVAAVEGVDLSEESVENTTLLIEDLKTQLAREKATSDDRLVEINGLEYQRDRMGRAFAEVVLMSFLEVKKLKRALTAVETAYAEEREKNHTNVIWKQTAEAYHRALIAEENKSLWQHLKEAIK